MKYAGKKVDGPNVEVVVIPRASGDLVFKAQAVLDYDDFDKLCPVPLPPPIIKKGGERGLDTNDKDYLAAMDKWASAKTNWMILKSLQATPDLEWETVDMSLSETWGNYEQELKDSGFSPPETLRIIQCVINACGLNQEKIDEATKRFLAGVVSSQNSEPSPDSEPKTTPSGEPASV